nr:hypothetical protein [Tanacetum cinerariifolium]
ASQYNGSQIKFKEINQIDEDDMEEMDIKWNMAILSMRADRFWKMTGKKITIQGIDVAWLSISLKRPRQPFRELKIGQEQRRVRIQCCSPPPAQVYSSPKKDLSWTGIPEFADDTVTDYSRPSPAIESTSDDAQNKNPYVPETEASPSTISFKPFTKFVKASDPPTVAN